MKKALMKDTVKEITNTFKRFISILLIVLLGVGFFAGIKATSPDMKNTIDRYFDDKNVMDIQVLSTLGLTKGDLEELQKIEGIEQVEGSYSTDVIVNSGEKEVVVKLMSLPTAINQVSLVEGRLPENNKECVVEPWFLATTNHQIGDLIKIEAEDIQNDDGEDQELLNEKKVTIVGTVHSPLYISDDRGTTKLGSGKINYYMYIPLGNFNTDIKTVAYITVNEAKELKTYTDQYDDIVQDIENKIDNISEQRRQERYQEIYDTANNKIEDAQKELNEQKEKADKEIKDAKKKIGDAKKEVQSGKAELANKKTSTTKQLNVAKTKLDQAEKELVANEKTFETEKKKAKEEIENAKQQLEGLKNIQEQYENATIVLQTLKSNLQTLQEQLKGLDPVTNVEQITALTNQIMQIQAQITMLESNIKKIETELEKQGIQASNLTQTITNIQAQITLAQAELTKNEQLLKQARKTLNEQKKKYETSKATASSEFATAQSKLDKAEKEIKDNEKKLQEQEKEANQKIQEAQEELEDAKIKLKEIKRPDWYILDRNQNVGYVSYLQETDRIANIAKVFPVVFFVVAALISLTSVTRMIEEQRVQIGTLKALGYSKTQIASKYIIYASLATIIGGLIGMTIGFYLIPRIICDMYAMMYTLPQAVLEFNMKYAIIGMLVAIACTVGATIYSCVKSLANTPANLMRPKAPKPGKRVLIEKMPFIWNHLNFIRKVTARNLFRYKKRFLMTIIGVAGCTSLIVAGFGLRDAVSDMIPAQYGKVFKYNIQITLKDNLKTKEIKEASEKIAKNQTIKNMIKVNMQSIEIVKNDNNQSIQLVVPEDVSHLQDFIKLENRKSKEKYTLNTDGVVITEKLSTLLDINKDDIITIKNADDIEIQVKIAGITENYLQHYIYMSPELYKKLYNEETKSNTILGITDNLSEDQEDILGKEILSDKEAISSVLFTSMTKDIFVEVMDKMTLVVWILIIAAGLLALVVLYNLSNTNISERIRELATIKVLGFYDKEVYDYVGKETIILTILGIIVGLIGGTFLTTFIIKTCELDAFMFNPEIKVTSYVYGVIITLVFASIVNITTYFALKKIDMIESLKSVE